MNLELDRLDCLVLIVVEREEHAQSQGLHVFRYFLAELEFDSESSHTRGSKRATARRRSYQAF